MFMPLILPSQLPAFQTLQDENIFVMPHQRAISQDIRPLEILIVNLMPDKIATETQLARMLANSPLQVKLTLLRMDTHQSTHTENNHLAAFYKTLEEIKQSRFDGMIVTGAPIEHIPYEEVDYWEELTNLFSFSKTNVFSTIFLCWGAMAALYHYYQIPKIELPQKLSGIYEHRVVRNNIPLVRGFDEHFYAPHSRSAQIQKQDILNIPTLQILAESEESGLHIFSTQTGKEIYVLGHMEYDKETLFHEYQRDIARGLHPNIPVHYFKNNDPNAPILYRWRSHGHLFFSNWLNYYVYQNTPFDLAALSEN